MFNLGLFPVVYTVVTLSAYIIPYTISTSLGHVYFWLPSISDSGVLSPESLVFREIMNLSGFLGMMNCVIRFLQYKLIITALDEEQIPDYVGRFNGISLVIGVVGGLSVTFVGNFQTKLHNAASIEYTIHDVAALVAFTTGILYSFIQSGLSYKMQRYGLNTKFTAHVRLMLSIGIMTCFLVFLVFGIFSNELFNAAYKSSDHERKLQWRPRDPGYVLHVCANIAEWSLCVIFVLFSLTFVREFSMIRITSSFADSHSIEELLSIETISNQDDDKEDS